MSLEKTTIIDSVEVTKTNHVQVREKIVVSDNGKEIAASFHRYVVSPGDDYMEMPDQVRAICAVVHTPETIAAYKAQIKNNEPSLKVEA